MKARRASGFLVGLLWLVLGSLLAPAALAEAPSNEGISLFWTAQVGCPSRVTAERWLSELIDKELVATAQRTYRVRIGRALGGRFEAEIVLQSELGDSTRYIEGPRCDRVAEAALLIIAVALDPIGLTNFVDMREAEHTKAAQEPASRAKAQGKLHSVLGVVFEGDQGSLPAPSMAAGLLVGLEYGRWRLALIASAWLPRATREEKGPPQGQMGLFSARIQPCVDLLTRVRLGVCAALELGLATGRGLAVKEAEFTSALWGAGFLGLSLRPPRGPSRFNPSLGLDLGAPFLRPVFAVDGYGSVFRASPLVGRLRIGLDLDFL